MDRHKTLSRIRVHASKTPDEVADARLKPVDDGNGVQMARDLEPFMGAKLRRSSSVGRDRRGDYLNVRSSPYLVKFLSKQGDKEVLFADRVLKFTESGKMKRRIFIITRYAIYFVDPETESLKRRIALDGVGKLILSELNDNFIALIVPREYDCLMATTRKTEIVDVLVEAIKRNECELPITFSNRFEYNPSSLVVKEVHFEEVEGGIRTRVLRKGGQ
ncbi:myosin heavy chain-like protein [Wolffia australiana]